MAWGDRERILNVPPESINRGDVSPDTLLRRILPGSGILLAGTGIGDETIYVDLSVAGNIPSTRTLTAGSHLSGGGDLSADRRFDVTQDTIDHDGLLNYAVLQHVDHGSVSVLAGTGLAGGGNIAANRTLAVASPTVLAGRTVTAGSHLAGGGDLTTDRQFDVTQTTIDHNALLNYATDNHVAHSGVSITAGTGLAGGGTIASSRTLSVASPVVLASRALVAGSYLMGGGDLSGDRQFDVAQNDLDHNALTNYISTEHIDHTLVSVVAGTGLTGGGNIATNRTLSVATPVVLASRIITAGSHLSGGGDLTVDRRLDVAQATIDHNALLNYATDNHVAHSGVSITAGTGLAGGGTIASSRTLSVASPVVMISQAPVSGKYVKWDGSKWVTDTPVALVDESRVPNMGAWENEPVGPGMWKQLYSVVNTAANLDYIWLAIDPGSSGDASQAWQYPLRITVDGTVEVNTIAGNFFASTFGAPRWGVDKIGCSYMSLESGDGRSSFYRYLTIPCASSLIVELRNSQAAATITLWSQVGIHVGAGNYGDRRQRFHAMTKTAATVLEYGAHVLVDATPGAGTLEGFMLAVDGNNTWSYLEGDVIIEIDGSVTHHYSGTEDAFLGSFYFGGVKWQTDRSGMTKQHTRTDNTPFYQSCFYRFFKDDEAIPFENSIKITWYNGESGQGVSPGNINSGVFSEVWYYTQS